MYTYGGCKIIETLAHISDGCSVLYDVRTGLVSDECSLGLPEILTTAHTLDDSALLTLTEDPTDLKQFLVSRLTVWFSCVHCFHALGQV